MNPRTAIRLDPTLLLAAALAAATACGSEERPKAEPQPLVLPSAAAAKLSDAQPTADELPVPEDFEDDAEREITHQNLHSELDTIERELDRDAHK